MSEDTRPDIEAARGRMSTKFGGKKELKRLTGHLYPGEEVLRMATGAYGGGIGLLVLTDQRLIFVKEGMMSQTLEDFPLDKIASVSWSQGMAQGKLTVHASGNKGEITNMAKVDGRALSDDLRARISGANVAAPASAAAPPPPPPPSVPAGWYPDPNGQQVQRYWDGGQWTEHTAPLA